MVIKLPISQVLVVLFLISCNRAEDCCIMQSCIETKIEEFKRSEVSNPPREVWQWVTGGITYYYVTSNCCDDYNFLYDVNCNEVCAPDGGFPGKGDGRCPEFAEPIEMQLVWRDPRRN